MMRVPYIINHISTTSKKRPGLKLTPKYLTIHSTANENSTALNERDWLTNPLNTSEIGWHICVDEKEAIEVIPLNEVAWHAGDGNKGIGNRQSVGIEICESGDRKKTLQNAVILIADLLEKFNLPLSAVKQHYDWSGKNCPRILRVGQKWSDFVDNVKMACSNATPKWKTDIIDEALKLGLITEKHNPDDVAEKWFVLATMINLYKVLSFFKN